MWLHGLRLNWCAQGREQLGGAGVSVELDLQLVGASTRYLYLWAVLVGGEDRRVGTLGLDGAVGACDPAVLSGASGAG